MTPPIDYTADTYTVLDEVIVTAPPWWRRYQSAIALGAVVFFAWAVWSTKR